MSASKERQFVLLIRTATILLETTSVFAIPDTEGMEPLVLV